MSEVIKTKDGIFIPKELIPDFENVEVDTSTPGVIVVKSLSKEGQALDKVLISIDAQREKIFSKWGQLSDSTDLIREDRDSR